MRAARILIGDESNRGANGVVRSIAEAPRVDTVPPTTPEQPASLSEYEARVEKERAAYKDCLNVHDLPKIAAYWHERHLLPMFQKFSISHPGEIFYIELLKRCTANPKLNQIVSVGSGNCDLEVSLAVFLKEKGCSNFVIECVDLNPDMLTRGIALATERGVADRIRATECDFNLWNPSTEYDVVLASQSLHHVVELEHLFDSVHKCLKSDGYFLTSDMIGRNGHMRWPEALDIVEEFWRELPGGYKYNQQLRRYEDEFDNWDCSKHGFEGIRSQDILPLLIERFQFEMFLAFGNVIDPFVDRGFGHNFRVEAEWDRKFIDRVHLRDEAELRAGTIKPTHMVAVMRKDRLFDTMRYEPPMTPEFAVRNNART